uniref:Uncharacterized protein n=1 Tax=Opuntia streptacantha TaxID=393608 RepID=A0A7C9DW28_OPUST
MSASNSLTTSTTALLNPNPNLLSPPSSPWKPSPKLDADLTIPLFSSNLLLLPNEISLSGKFIETLNLDFANFCRQSEPPLTLLGCRGDCLRIPFGRSLNELVRKLLILGKTSSSWGIAGAMENRAALKVAILMGFEAGFV